MEKVDRKITKRHGGVVRIVLATDTTQFNAADVGPLSKGREAVRHHENWMSKWLAGQENETTVQQTWDR